MAQGTRNRWVRVATTGLGVLVCTGLVGCMNTDKDKKDKGIVSKTPAPGLPGTSSIPNGAATKLPTNPYGTSGIQQTGGFGQPADRSGMNTLKTSVPAQNFGGPNYTGTTPPATISAPTNPNPNFVPSPLPGQGTFQPAGGVPTAPGGFTGSNTSFSPSPVASGGRMSTGTPPAPSLADVGPIPPSPPLQPTPGFASAGAPPADTFPIAPPVPPAPPLGNSANAFGPK